MVVDMASWVCFMAFLGLPFGPPLGTERAKQPRPRSKPDTLPQARREHRKARLAPRPRSGRGNSEKANMPPGFFQRFPEWGHDFVGFLR